jgi:hypothetical protein
MTRLSFWLLLFAAAAPAAAQSEWVSQCEGVWSGTMHIFSRGEVKDSVSVRLTLAARPEPGTWTWKMEYLSPKQPAVKDYVLRHREGNRFVMDEGGGVELPGFLFGNKLISQFEVQGIYLTSTMELVDGRIVFEVTSGKASTPVAQGINVYSVEHVQRVTLQKLKRP